MTKFVMKGVRLKVEYDEEGHPILNTPQNPGEYWGPIMGYTGKLPAVFFLKPNSRDPGVPAIARSVQHVTSPPHKFFEEPDGTLTITASIGDTRRGSSESDGWHGYLTRGEWVLA